MRHFFLHRNRLFKKIQFVCIVAIGWTLTVIDLAGADTQFRVTPLDGWVDVSPTLPETTLKNIKDPLLSKIKALRATPKTNFLFIQPEQSLIFHVWLMHHNYSGSMDEELLDEIVKGIKKAEKEAGDSPTWTVQEKGFIAVQKQKVARILSIVTDGKDQIFVLNYNLLGKKRSANVSCYIPPKVFEKSKDLCEAMVKHIQIIDP